MSGPPRLSLSTGTSGAGPSTPASSQRRPQGARRRGQVQGLFVANPDNSDSDVSPKSSPVRSSPVTTSSSGSGGRPISSLQQQYAGGGGGGGGGVSPRSGKSTAGFPSVPAPNTPLTAFPSPHPAPRTPASAPHPPPSAPPDIHQNIPHTAPQPPPQPERHFQRAFTTPILAQDQPQRPQDVRHSSLTGTGTGIGFGTGHPASPTRHLPPLPSPDTQSAQSTQSTPQFPSPSPSSTTHAHQLPIPPTQSTYAQPEASGSRPHLQHLHTLLKTNSPDDMMSPAAISEGGKSFASLGSGESIMTRARSGSVTSHRIVLQATTDNENFVNVDITGMNSAEGIMERVFSKLRFRDEDYPTLSLFRTNIGEDSDHELVPRDNLLGLCQEHGDARASLKFLVLQTTIPGSAASIVPPVHAELPPIDTQVNRSSGSLHSASGSSAHDRQSDWSDLGMEYPGASGLHRSKHNVRHVERRLPSASSSSRSLNQIDNHQRDSRTSSPRSFVNVDHPSPRIQPPRNATPGPASAGPSRHMEDEAGLGLFVDDGMDPETRALIEQMKREDDLARRQEEARRAQEAADERFARNAQQQERDVWQMMQEQSFTERRAQQDQIASDAQRAREVEAEERRHMEEQQQQQQRSEATRRDSHSHNQSRTATFVRDRQVARQEWSQRNEATHEGWNRPPIGAGPSYRDGRRPSDTPPYLPGQQIYTSPSAQFGSEIPNVYVRQPSRQSSGRYEEEDPHYLARLRPGERLPPGAGLQQRQPTRHPYGYTNPDGAYALQNARSMDSLRYDVPPVSRPPYQAIPARATHTPQPGYQAYRSPSTERVQDGRYPDAARAPPQIGSVPFPSPRPRRQDSGEHSWLPYVGSPRDFDGSRPSTVHYDRSPPIATSPTTGTLPQRPSTLYDSSPPQTAGYFPPGARTPQYSSSRRNSVDHVRSRTPAEEGLRRASESSAGDPRELDPAENTWRGLTRSSRKDRTDTGDSASVAGTVSSGVSEATLRPRRDDETETARSGDLQSQWRAMVQKGRGGTLMPAGRVPESAFDDDEEEATLWITGPRTDSPAIRPGMERSPSRPNLTISTLGRTQPDPSLTSASDSNTESEAEDGTRIQRARSFAKPKDQWYFRPEPEQLYANLDALFPKIDLDKPIVEGLSTPTTPNDTPSTFPPPPLHPARALDSRQPQSPHNDKTAKEKEKSGTVGAALMNAAFGNRFNKGENRKSIRVVADFARRAIARDNKDKKAEAAEPATNSPASDKLERRKSSSMWDHQVVEVTPSIMASGQPAPIPESPSTETEDIKPPILSWVKGELIGKGSYGRVYIAMNVTTGDMMAVKQVELPATDRDRQDDRQLGMIEALRGEIALLKDLYHPNIVQYLGTETSPEYLSIFLEYVPGGTIASIYRTPGQTRFEEQLVKFFTKQILEGLAYLHNKQILHRDLKGDNILVDNSGICKISDFGISKQASDAYDSFGQATNMKGSVFWMAPEVIHSASERTYSGKVDIWSLGCVVMEMWTGQRPWGIMEQVAAMFELFNKRARPPLPAEIQSQMSHVALDFLNERCLAKDPRDRPTAKELLQHRFITETDDKWTFRDSEIGKEVASRGMRRIKAHHAAQGSNG